MNVKTNERGFLLCPVCHKPTNVKANADTALERFPLFCRWCKQEILVDKPKE